MPSEIISSASMWLGGTADERCGFIQGTWCRQLVAAGVIAAGESTVTSERAGGDRRLQRQRQAAQVRCALQTKLEHLSSMESQCFEM